MATSLDITVLTGRCIDALRKQGCVTRQCNDYPEIEAFLGALGIPEPPARFSPRWQELPRANAFWLVAESLQGAPLAAIGVRLDKLGGEALNVYWMRQLAHLQADPAFASVDPANAPPVARHISGNTVYFSELFQKAAAKNRAKFDTDAFQTLVISLAMLQWSVDWFYALARADSAASHPMSRSYPLIGAGSEASPDRMLCMDVEDAHYLVDSALERRLFL
ncbi:MAG: hypothetical protein AAF401_00910 [Pseudomonadota bacterium]